MIDPILDGLSETVTVERRGAVTFDRGRSVSPDPTTFTIVGSVQPMRPDELETLPELDRSSSAIKIYTATLLRTAERGGPSADVVLYNDRKWKVTSAERHAEGLINHFKIIAQRIEK